MKQSNWLNFIPDPESSDLVATGSFGLYRIQLVQEKETVQAGSATVTHVFHFRVRLEPNEFGQARLEAGNADIESWLERKCYQGPEEAKELAQDIENRLWHD